MAETTQKSNNYGLAIVGGISAMTGIGLQVKPEDAVSNLSLWLKFFGVDRVPSFLATTQADTWGTVIGLALSVLSIVIWWKRRNVPVIYNATPAMSYTTVLPVVDQTRLLAVFAELEDFLFDKVIPALEPDNALQLALHNEGIDHYSGPSFAECINHKFEQTQALNQEWKRLLDKHDTTLKLSFYKISHSNVFGNVEGSLHEIRDMIAEKYTERKVFNRPLETLRMSLKYALDDTKWCKQSIKEAQIKIGAFNAQTT